MGRDLASFGETEERRSPIWPWGRAPDRSRPDRQAARDRVAKYNQLLRIEEALGGTAPFAGRTAIKVLKAEAMHRLVLLRHGESTWNRENRFTGWTDVDLNDKGPRKRTKPAVCLMG